MSEFLLTRVGGIWHAQFNGQKCGILVIIKQDTKPEVKKQVCETCQVRGKDA